MPLIFDLRGFRVPATFLLLYFEPKVVAKIIESLLHGELAGCN